MADSALPQARVIHVDTRGAQILTEASPETRDSRGIYLPNYIEPVSHIAVDIGGSLAKVVYFTRSPQPPNSPSVIATDGSNSEPASLPDSPTRTTPPQSQRRMNGALTPLLLESHINGDGHLNGNGDNSAASALSPAAVNASLLRHRNFPGGSLNFERYETSDIESCVAFIQTLIERSAQVNGVSLDEMRKTVQIMATGGGAHKFGEDLAAQTGVPVAPEDEMECLIAGLRFLTQIPGEAYYFSDDLIQHTVSYKHAPEIVVAQLPSSTNGVPLPRPSPNPPKYSVSFLDNPEPQLPCLLVNIGSGVSIIRVDEDGTFERVSGTSLGGGTLWGLLSLLTPARSFDEMLALSENGDNETVDMLVGDIYGSDYSKLGLKSTTIASSFGKVFKKGADKKQFSAEDISKSLLYAVSNNIGQIAYMNAEKYGLDRIYFGGCFIRGHAATIATLSYAIRFWSKGTKRALFLRHEGFLGAIGAWLRNMEHT
ncbi:fumble [Exidia glandulosa HHB12029]|uniref:Fumble n=1 Tax=Exidia glandulosa HHB12029 TaxID=1314781 RepID=A0A165ZNA0_EXIGL|nr:fumble [Exidia glandulosa HHB12029]